MSNLRQIEVLTNDIEILDTEEELFQLRLTLEEVCDEISDFLSDCYLRRPPTVSAYTSKLTMFMTTLSVRVNNIKIWQQEARLEEPQADHKMRSLYVFLVMYQDDHDFTFLTEEYLDITQSLINNYDKLFIERCISSAAGQKMVYEIIGSRRLPKLI